jgi:hypothetical protein
LVVLVATSLTFETAGCSILSRNPALALLLLTSASAGFTAFAAGEPEAVFAFAGALFAAGLAVVFTATAVGFFGASFAGFAMDFFAAGVFAEAVFTGAFTAGRTGVFTFATVLLFAAFVVADLVTVAFMVSLFL